MDFLKSFIFPLKMRRFRNMSILFAILIFIMATYLAIVAALPIIMSWSIKSLPSSVSIGGTSIIIIIGVALETVKQIKTKVQEQQYRGFLD